MPINSYQSAELYLIYYTQPIPATQTCFCLLFVTLVLNVASNKMFLLGQSYHLTGEDILSPYIQLFFVCRLQLDEQQSALRYF